MFKAFKAWRDKAPNSLDNYKRAAGKNASYSARGGKIYFPKGSKYGVEGTYDPKTGVFTPKKAKKADKKARRVVVPAARPQVSTQTRMAMAVYGD